MRLFAAVLLVASLSGCHWLYPTEFVGEAISPIKTARMTVSDDGKAHLRIEYGENSVTPLLEQEFEVVDASLHKLELKRADGIEFTFIHSHGYSVCDKCRLFYGSNLFPVLWKNNGFVP